MSNPPKASRLSLARLKQKFKPKKDGEQSSSSTQVRPNSQVYGLQQSPSSTQTITAPAIAHERTDSIIARANRTGESHESSHNVPELNHITNPRSTADVLSNNSKTVISDPSSIHGLWNEAYEELKVKEESLIEKYERKLGIRGSIVSASGIGREELMKKVVDGKLKEYKDGKLNVNGIAVKDMMEPVVGLVKWADTYVSDAISANPIASIAWAGVTVFLPLLLNPSKQEASLVEGLTYISNVLVRSAIQENVYHRRWETNAKTSNRDGFAPAHRGFRDTLKQLYILVLKYQAESVCYFTKNGLLRFSRDIVKWDDWTSLLKDIERQDGDFQTTYEILGDVVIQEEFEKQEQRHTEMFNVQMSSLKVQESMSEKLSTIREAIDNANRYSKRKEFLEWLSSSRPEHFYNSLRAKLQHQTTTGNWLIKESQEFVDWKEVPNSLLWLNGKAGSGKSVLTSSVIDHLVQMRIRDPRIGVAFYFFRFDDKERSSATDMLASIIRQLCECRQDTPEAVTNLRSNHGKDHIPTLESTLQAAIQGFTDVYLIMDALDECPRDKNQLKDLLDSLRRVQNLGLQNTHLMCTSRREVDIEVVLAPLAKNGLGKADINLTFRSGKIDRDISIFIDSAFESESFAFWGPDLKAEAKLKLVEKADGMFQYVACQRDLLAPLQNRKKIQQALDGLPDGLNETYNQMLDAIEPDYHKQVASALKWIAYSVRRLRLREVAEVFVFHNEQEGVTFDESNRLLAPEAVLKYLRGFVIASQGEIQLAHFSIQEYLSSNPPRMPEAMSGIFQMEEIKVHEFIVEASLAYIVHSSKTPLEFGTMDETLPLWEYVAKRWLRHLDRLPNLGQRITDKLSRLEHDDQAFSNLIIDLPPYLVQYRKPPSLLHYAAQHGSLQLVRPCIAVLKCDIDQVNEGGETALMDTMNLYPEIARFLVENGADINFQVQKKSAGELKVRTPLQAAICYRRDNIVRLILERGADVNAKGGSYGTALHIAASVAKVDIIKLLLDYGPDVDAEAQPKENALQAAVARGNKGIIKLLLEYGADVNAKAGPDGTALQIAVEKIRRHLTEILHEHNANVNAKVGPRGSALQVAVDNRADDIVQLLLDLGADVNAPGPSGTALHIADWEGHLETAKLLLEHGADVNAPGPDGTALIKASGMILDSCPVEQLQIVRLLLAAGGDVNERGGDFGNVLQAAIARDNWQVMEELLSRGATLVPAGIEWDEMRAVVKRENFSARLIEARTYENDLSTYVGIVKRREEKEREYEKWREEQWEEISEEEEANEEEGTSEEGEGERSGEDLSSSRPEFNDQKCQT